MPLILLAVGGVALIAGTSFAGYEAGQAAGTGIGNAAVIVGIGIGVGVIIYAMHKK